MYHIWGTNNAEQNAFGLGQLDFNPGGGLDWTSIINRGIDVAGARLSRSPYYSPDDPRYQTQGGPMYYPQGPVYQGPPGSDYPLGNVGASGVQLSQTTILLIGLAAALFLFGRSRR